MYSSSEVMRAPEDSSGLTSQWRCFLFISVTSSARVTRGGNGVLVCDVVLTQRSSALGSRAAWGGCWRREALVRMLEGWGAGRARSARVRDCRDGRLCDLRDGAPGRRRTTIYIHGSLLLRRVGKAELLSRSSSAAGNICWSYAKSVEIFLDSKPRARRQAPRTPCTCAIHAPASAAAKRRLLAAICHDFEAVWVSRAARCPTRDRRARDNRASLGRAAKPRRHSCIVAKRRSRLRHSMRLLLSQTLIIPTKHRMDE